MEKKTKNWCKYCHGTGKVFDFTFGAWYPCNTEHDCEMTDEEV